MLSHLALGLLSLHPLIVGVLHILVLEWMTLSGSVYSLLLSSVCLVLSELSGEKQPSVSCSVHAFARTSKTHWL
jgi:hypothetical protein